jgi:1-deoxy-D-xylulose-5-phosphate reductoisomerase
MRMPIQYALTWPDRLQAPVPKIDWSQARQWTFEPPDYERFPLLRLAYQAQEAGGSATCTLNAADEVAVAAFLEGRIDFPAIASVVSDTLSNFPHRRPTSISDILDIDAESRQFAQQFVLKRESSPNQKHSLKA